MNPKLLPAAASDAVGWQQTVLAFLVQARPGRG